MAIYQLPGSNAVADGGGGECADEGVVGYVPGRVSAYDVPLDTTKAVSSGIHEIVITLLEALGACGGGGVYLFARDGGLR